MVDYWGNRCLWLFVVAVLLVFFTRSSYNTVTTSYEDVDADPPRDTGGKEVIGTNVLDMENIQRKYYTTPSGKDAIYEHEVADYESVLKDSVVDDVIVMAVISRNIMDMTMNFYVSSITKFNVRNLLFIAADHESCQYVMDRHTDVNFRCFVFKEDNEPVSVLQYRNSGGVFSRRTNMKPAAALAAIRLGYNVLITDVDIIFLKNPVSYVKSICANNNYDMAIQREQDQYNTGFVYVRPTTASLRILSLTVERSQTNHANDQILFNKVLDDLKPDARPKIMDLGSYRFPSAKYYFVGSQCPNETRKEEVYIVHGNWLKFHTDKINRFKDCLLWEYDGDDGYYSNKTRRYITYTDHVTSEKLTASMLNLFTLGRLLNRTVILPRVLREGHAEVDNSWRIIKGTNYEPGGFDIATRMNYRLGNFLRHRLVPESVHSSVSVVYSVGEFPENQVQFTAKQGDSSDIQRESPNIKGKSQDHEDYVVLKNAVDPKHDLKASDVIQFFGSETSSVLRLKPMLEFHKYLKYENILSLDLFNILIHKRLNPE